MRHWLVALLCFLQPAAPAVRPPDAPVDVAPGVWVIRGGSTPGRGPDGNTTILDAPDGLVVVDTGRHVEHSDAVLAFARSKARPIVALVNTHWHLDHSSGNRRLKAAYPSARLFTTTAVDRALADGGFLVRDLDQVKTLVSAPETSAVTRDEMQIFVDTMAAPSSLRPDVPLDRSAPLALGGRPVQVHVSKHAVTDADTWLYDQATRTAVLGDLVTVPVPYFETACPKGWSAALDEVWDTPFATAVPGHGAVLSREAFGAYRTAFHTLVGCIGTSRPARACGDEWTTGIASLIGPDVPVRTRVAQDVEFYVEYLRKNGGASADCLAK